MPHTVPVHPGSQVQTSGAVHTPFSHEELHIAGRKIVLCLSQEEHYINSRIELPIISQKQEHAHIPLRRRSNLHNFSTCFIFQSHQCFSHIPCSVMGILASPVYSTPTYNILGQGKYYKWGQNTTYHIAEASLEWSGHIVDVGS